MATRRATKVKGGSFDLEFEFNRRVISQHLGEKKYSTTARALGELVANGLDAGAGIVEVAVLHNGLGHPQSIVVQDNGHGMTKSVLENRFRMVGVEMPSGTRRLGRFGVGRLAVFRVGTLSEWTTVSASQKGKVKFSFRMDENDRENLHVKSESVKASTPTGTRIEIFNLRDAPGPLAPAALRSELLLQFCTLLLGNTTQQIVVQDERLDVDALIQQSWVENLEGKYPAQLTHVTLNRNVQSTRLPQRIIFSVKGRTVVETDAPDLQPNYVAVVDCPDLEDSITANNEAILDLDESFAALKSEVLDRARAFNRRLVADQASQFLQRARRQPFYPYKHEVTDPLQQVERTIYETMLEKVHEEVDLEQMTKRQQKVVYELLKRAMKNDNFLEILQAVTDLSDDDVDRFRRVLEKTTLQSIVHLTAEVQSRLDFLDALHELVYGDQAKHLRERSQLHKVVERHCWMFDPRFYMATASDKAFTTILRKHREHSGLEAADEAKLAAIEGIDDIPDLFFSATRSSPERPKSQHLVVEIKAPRVTVGDEELQQLRRYARTVHSSQEFDKIETIWDFYIVSSRLGDAAEFERRQVDEAHPGLLGRHDNVRLWAFTWAELIERARQEMNLVRERLKRTSAEVKLQEYLEENFPSVFRQEEEPEPESVPTT